MLLGLSFAGPVDAAVRFFFDIVFFPEGERYPEDVLVCRLSFILFFARVYTVKHRLSGWTVFLSLLLLCLPVLVSAQEATIVGTVTDPSGAVVPNVAILVTNVDTGAMRTLATNDAGQYVVPGLLIGKYDLEAQASGFEVEAYKGVVLDVNDRIRVDFQMKLGQKRDAILVESNPVAVQADSGEQSSLVSGTQISELTKNGRSIYTYITLSPGAANLMPSFQPPTSVGGNSNVVGTARDTTSICSMAERIMTAAEAATRSSSLQSMLLPKRKYSPRTIARNMDFLPAARSVPS